MKKFKIPSIPPTTNKCIRFPNNIIDQVEKEIEGKDCTFSAFVIESVKVALENLEESRKETEKEKNFQLQQQIQQDTPKVNEDKTDKD